MYYYDIPLPQSSTIIAWKPRLLSPHLRREKLLIVDYSPIPYLKPSYMLQLVLVCSAPPRQHVANNFGTKQERTRDETVRLMFTAANREGQQYSGQ